MKIGVISDIHSNIYAFQAAVERLEGLGCEEYLLLGDYVSDTPYTRETMDCLYAFLEKHVCHILRGNREEYMLSQRQVLRENREDEKWLFNSASGNLLFAYEQLTESDLDFFDSLPRTFVYAKEGLPAITCAHGSPDNTRELLELYGENTREWMEKVPTKYLLCAHTHFPGKLEVKDKIYFNTGCVGISIHDAGFAQCMTLETKEVDGEVIWEPVFLKVPYDNEQVVRDMHSSGQLEKGKWFVNSNIQILLTGEDYAAQMVILAAKLAKEAGETTRWPHIKECYFEKAARELGIPDYRE